jgi:hypothetical protein
MLLGIPGDNTYANYQEANRSLWRQTVLPVGTRIAKALSQWLAPAYDAPLELRPDLDAIEALTPEREALWSRLEKATFVTQDEKRAAVGYGPAESPSPLRGGVRGGGTHESGDVLPPGANLPYKYPGQPRIAAGQREGGRYTFGRTQGRRFFGRFPAAKPPKDAGAGFGGTPKGLQFTEHGRKNATDRKFTEQRIDAIVENNAKTRVGKVDLDGKKDMAVHGREGQYRSVERGGWNRNRLLAWSGKQVHSKGRIARQVHYRPPIWTARRPAMALSSRPLSIAKARSPPRSCSC